jgi:hypothetical protein
VLRFSATFILFFFQIALGGLFALAATPFQELDRAFYKSTAGVLYVISLFALWGTVSLYGHTAQDVGSTLALLEVLCYTTFAAAFSCYLISLWGERQLFRARSFSASLLTGLLALMLSSQKFHGGSVISLEAVLFSVSFFFSSLLLGTVTVGMLLGHWYLIDTGQTLAPFVRIYRFFFFSLIAQGLLLLVSPAALYILGSAETIANLRKLWENHSFLLVGRALVGQAAPLVLSFMIGRTLKIPHTMAATGLF